MGSYKPTKLYEQEIHTITIPESVRLSGHPTPSLTAEAVSFLHKDGIIILDNAIAPSHLTAINAVLSPEAELIAAGPTHHFNFGRETRNMDQAPPPTKDLMFKDVWCNPFAAAVLAAVMGPQPVVHYANGNTALKGTGRQPVHSDCDFKHPIFFPHAYVININLVDVGEENGATEVWVGSHHVSTAESHVSDDGDGEGMLKIRDECLEERCRHSPPVRACTKKGSLVIRDLRLWHAGMPNLTNEPRVMLAFVAQPAWWEGRSKVLLPMSVKEMVEGWGEMRFEADWVDGDVDHKKLSSLNVDFDTGSEGLEKWREELGEWPEYVPRYY
jgi:ectoine hydroxylase-related dioxygenase (phytanoyl-CoA dioxygenase family)